ncbi:hypothetical protein BDP55DRAFT_410934 [Colletotrichum godetiae]|uniref:Uncharacterized protein n=1 Tax=Colletotrichum godetiae TaxID=1209918 RepID=A0AAJ0ASG0_9PEZI|nr:uncharacterized protein BDP55DRAFT_410934 [Colletotrichum godetiae]KAK1689538.1 hypothetical protein BDP55DRAFT_410934 [Colletotrichum godetiae]
MNVDQASPNPRTCSSFIHGIPTEIPWLATHPQQVIDSQVVNFSWQLGHRATPLHPQTGATLLHARPPRSRLNRLSTAKSSRANFCDVRLAQCTFPFNCTGLDSGALTETSSGTPPALHSSSILGFFESPDPPANTRCSWETLPSHPYCSLFFGYLGFLFSTIELAFSHTNVARIRSWCWCRPVTSSHPCTIDYRSLR